jgi:holo-[acyl-carrier protein] synthase
VAAFPELPPGAAATLVGIGVDLVDLDRLRVSLARTPRLIDRLFTEAEQAYAFERHDPTERFGGRFAVKEATLKAMGVGLGAARFRDLEVVRAESGAPELVLHGAAAERATALGVRRWLLTVSHTDHLAEAIVVGLADTSPPVEP